MTKPLSAHVPAAPVFEPAPETAPTLAQQSVSRQMLAKAWTSWEFKIGLFVFICIILMTLFYPWISGIDATKMAVSERFTPPIPFEGSNWTHVLGTDQLGRDMLVRSLIGLRYSLLIGIVTVVLMFIVGSAVGIAAGFKGGRTDAILMRITDAQLAIPMIILAIAILGVSRPTVPAIIAVLALSGWPLYARVARSAVLSESKKQYILAARILGASNWRIVLLLIAPNVLPPIAFVAVLDVARMMIFEAILGFLGLGVQPPTPSFGNIIADGRKYLINHWWIATMPGVFLLISLTSINLMGSAFERARSAILSGQ